MTTFEQIKGAVFDLDGVITDTARFHSQAWKQIADKVGAGWDDDLADSLKGIDRMASLDLILKHGGKQNDFSDAEKEALATEKNTRYLKLVDTLTPADILPGIQAFLDALQAGGYKLALASASKNAPRVLKNLGLTEYFPHIVDPATLTHGKPDPEIFVKAAASIDLAPEACIGIEDAAAGVQGINAAGEVSVGIGDAEVLHEADIIFPSTAELTLPNIKAAMEKGDVNA
ncbi:beta-phosphoglucomutase [Lacticaseibacillus camelliae]|uniref:Beta-phosphoglucomutase n=1 Tax=Lacticaseibacillus camelliae DSM 22697 = JCM 13995 TaxID=1423730 RepID=A0A0R2F2F7_9LACO|nr:beta-phosphoglucomutase [Lacticaseibacillus camelliae]KRN18685.1 beta-phosphoglucomutase [Lacticaseibacillus camelliae DSM 22697 = JCM 13995]